MSRSSRGAALLTLSLIAPPAVLAGEGAGGALMGWVEDGQGVPVAGAVISLFGKGVGRSGMVTFSDNAGRFFVPSLPAGSYTLRALGHGLRPAPPRQVTILPNQSSIFSVSLSQLGELSEAEAAERSRELSWLLRHKARSVLETRDPAPKVAANEAPTIGSVDLLSRVGPLFSSLGGTVEVMANSPAFGSPALAEDDGGPARFSVIRLGGRLAESGRWSLGGLVAESESAAWRTAAEFSFHPGGGHEISAGAGYGSPMLRPASLSTRHNHVENHGVGAICLQDRWDVGPLTSIVGARYSYVGFLDRANHVDPQATLELHRDDGSILRGSITMRTLVPGGDLLTLSTLSSGPAISFAVMDPGLRPERMARYELAVDRPVGGSTVTAHTFYEGTRDQLVNAFEGPKSSRSLRIFNTRSLAARGVGMSFAHRFGNVMKGSLTYTYGRSWRSSPIGGTSQTVYLGFREGDFHDIVTRIETQIDRSDTRLVAFYRLNALSPDSSEAMRGVTSSRFDLQLHQGLPFLGVLTRADWELLLAYRNLFYEASEGATLDELTVVNPPKRVLGGLSVRF